MVRLEHARRLGYCARGMRRWFEGRGVSWQEFVERGVPADWAMAQGDAMAEAAAKIALAEAGIEADDGRQQR